MLRTLAAATALAVACPILASSASAQTIYPLNRAEILSGAKFDFKVEFPGAPPQADVKVTIDGRDPAEVFGKPATFVQREDGQDYAAYVIRDVALTGAATHVIEASAGAAAAAKVQWEVFATPAPRTARNVILFIGDGLSVGHRTAARILSKGMVEGRYGGELAIDEMPAMALVSTSGTDSVVTDSANAMSAYTTGHKSCVNALGVYCARNKNTLEHPRVETLGELAHRRGLALGVVTNTEIEDATPAGMVAHTRRRADYNDIVKMFWAVKPEVVMGGGSPNWLAKSTPGSRRADETDYIKLFEQGGWTFAATATEMNAAAQGGATKLLGLFNTGNVDGALDRKFLHKGSVDRFPDQPDLTDQVRVALQMLEKSENGFMLMVESGRIDKYSHSLDAERAIYDTIMLDNAVRLAKEWSARRGEDTLIIVVGDHGHPVSVIGTYDDARGDTPREKLGTYAEARFPNYPPADASGYPPRVDVSRRIALNFGSYPDWCFNAQPYLDGENVPAVAGNKPKTFVANEKYCNLPGAVRMTGNLPFDGNTAVHAADDVVLTATGPGSAQFHGRIDNTRVFRAIATTLSLGN